MPMVLLSALLPGCTHSELPPPPFESSATESSATESDGATESTPGGDTALPQDTGADEVDRPCPPEMQPVPDEGEPLYCIDRWEVRVEGELGDADQYSEGAEPTTAVTRSAEGAVPSIGVSFGQAVMACANTPVLDAAGEVVGYKHLVTGSEWLDAADGQVGEGGSDYPYGDTFDETKCACQSEAGEPLYRELQPAGSLPGCVSAFGVYDQSGNAWEWADPEVAMDIEAWFEGAESSGIVARDEGGYLASVDGAMPRIVVQGVLPETAVVVDGLVQVTVEQASWDYVEGGDPLGYAAYLIEGDEMAWLPIEIEVMDLEAPVSQGWVRIMSERDGHPLTNKVGGAYYTDPGTCKTSGEPSRDHPHDFSGTIGFRCASEPLE